MIPFPSIKTVLTLPSLALLVACGGSSSQVSFSELLERGEALDAASIAAADETGGDALPSGTASFSGVTSLALAAIEDEVAPAMLGALEVSVNFDTGTINGNGSSFYQTEGFRDEDEVDLAGVPVNGSLSFTLTQTGADQNLFTGATSGSITTTDARTEALSADATGKFLGAQAEGFRFDTVEAGDAVAISGFALKN